ncbi:MAG: aminopeptidase P family protein [Pirellulales bacterium]|nr:aminopeptidase P family protein [Pirellulales bacterium]
MADRTSMMNRPFATLLAGIPEINATLYHRIRFLVGDPAAWISIPREDGSAESVLILRDIEMERARHQARADRIACPADFAPECGLSGDRETATAQAVAECLRRNQISSIVADRSLPLIFAEFVRQAGVSITCDMELGILDRRAKDAQEIEWLRDAQQVTESATQMACELVASASVRKDGVLIADHEPLTSERVRIAIDRWFIDRAYMSRPSIVAGGPAGGDCHEIGSGELRTGQPVIIDIFPKNQSTRYNGDCTRTVVHGAVPDELAAMHNAVVEAKAAAIKTIRAGVTGERVHLATKCAITGHGYAMGLADAHAPDSYCAMTHGTGHGVGLEVHEPPLLDMGGPELIAGDAVTVEPGLYRKSFGGVRVEDMVIVTQDGCLNLNTLHEGLDWS